LTGGCAGTAEYLDRGGTYGGIGCHSGCGGSIARLGSEPESFTREKERNSLAVSTA
jgi:hypothetical protein